MDFDMVRFTRMELMIDSPNLISRIYILLHSKTHALIMLSLVGLNAKQNRVFQGAIFSPQNTASPRLLYINYRSYEPSLGSRITMVISHIPQYFSMKHCISSNCTFPGAKYRMHSSTSATVISHGWF